MRRRHGQLIASSERYGKPPVGLCSSPRGALVSPAVEVRLIALREVRRNVRSLKGIALGVITLLGAFISALVCVSIEGADRARAVAENEAFGELKRKAVEQVTGDASLASYIASAPSSLLSFLKITIWLAPLLVALVGFDGVAGELQNRTVRYWTVRTRRSSYFAGKLLGLWAVVALVMLVIHVLADGVALARGYVTIGQIFTWSPRFWLVGVLIAGAWAAIATLVSASFRAPVVALMTTFVVFFALWLCGAIAFASRTMKTVETSIAIARQPGGGHEGLVVLPPPWYEYLYPNAYDSMLLSPDASKVLTATVALVGFVAIVIVVGSALFQRRDV
jgi:ABC-type transport system involved in multi-copper enzyme maturation permease subunit